MLSNYKWPKAAKTKIWDYYINKKVNELVDDGFAFDQKIENMWDWRNEAPCPVCGKKMLRTQFVQEQAGKFRWDINFLDGNIKNLKLSNCEPTHPDCVKETENE